MDGSDSYRHSKWLSFMQKRLKIAKRLLNPKDSVLIVTIDEKEYLHLGCLLEEMFLEARMQMISALTNSRGVARENGFARVDEYIYVLQFGESSVDCILFAADDSCRAKLGEYAKEKLREFSRKYRVAIANKSDSCKKKYREIMADSAEVSEQLFAIPENIHVKEDPDGIEYDNHLLASPETGIAKIKLNGWEADLIDEEAHRSDFLCWLRNPSRAAWALCLPYDMNGEKKSFYPDFLIVRSDPMVEYVIDVLEPHGNQYADNLPKAKALAEYAKAEDRLGRIQLIHKTTDASGTKFVRLDLTDIAVRDKVLRVNSDDELNNIFTNYGEI